MQRSVDGAAQYSAGFGRYSAQAFRLVHSTLGQSDNLSACLVEHQRLSVGTLPELQEENTTQVILCKSKGLNKPQY